LNSFVPTGLVYFNGFYSPAINRWAIIINPIHDKE
jgi:hypothetical protein